MGLKTKPLDGHKVIFFSFQLHHSNKLKQISAIIFNHFVLLLSLSRGFKFNKLNKVTHKCTSNDVCITKDLTGYWANMNVNCHKEQKRPMAQSTYLSQKIFQDFVIYFY